ncbi:Ureidoglycolate hydrolase [Capsicum chinense]|nr:Ureidoglycolate hydrolase [Capsicum chinense]
MEVGWSVLRTSGQTFVIDPDCNGLHRYQMVFLMSGFKPQRSLEVIMFTSEEPTRFGISCLGSRLLAGIVQLTEQLKSTKDSHNVSFFDAVKSAGYTNAKGDLSEVSLKKGTYSAFVKLHIEQGVSIGVVTDFAAPASIKVTFEGSGGHAGAALMPERNDAGLATAELALAVEKHVLNSGSVDTVGTVGELLDCLRDPSGMTIAMLLESIAAKSSGFYLLIQNLNYHRSGFKPQRSLEVIMFTSEEPTRFGISCLGSRLLAGIVQLTEQLKSTKDSHNVSFFDAVKSAGYTNAKGDLSEVSLKKGTYSAFVKLHIEQGVSIGVVTDFAAPASIKVTFEGSGGHAGAALMPERNDAGLATAELALAVEKHVLNSGSVDTVGTVGELLDCLRDPSGMTIAMLLESIAAKDGDEKVACR